MKDYDVLVEFLKSEHREVYSVEATSEEEAKKEALYWARDDLEVIDVEEINEVSEFKKNRQPRFKHYLLTQVNQDGTRWTLLEDNNIGDLVKIAEKISLPEADKVEVIGTNDSINDYKSRFIIFTREL